MVIIKLQLINGIWCNKDGQSIICQEYCPKNFNGILKIVESKDGILLNCDKYGSVKYFDGTRWRYLYANLSRLLKSKFNFPVTVKLMKG